MARLRPDSADHTLRRLGIASTARDTVVTALRTGRWDTVPWLHGPAEAPLPVGTLLADRYELDRILGRGSFGAVYQATDRATAEPVAVKVLLAPHPREVERMHKEIAVLRLLRLPGVVGFRDEGEWDGQPWVAMDLAEGVPFPGTADRSWEALSDPVLALVETLTRVHEAGVVHRDLKPANVLVHDGRPVVLDFGLARSDAVGVGVSIDQALAGTPAYLSPEQFFGGEPDERSDLYALGVMLYEALAGRLPHTGDDVHELVRAALMDSPTPLRTAAPEVPERIADLVMALLSREPRDRPESAADVLRVLRGGMRSLTLRRLGRTDVLDRIIAELRAGRSVDVGGHAGSGRSRLVADAVAVLTDEGRQVLSTAPADVPYRSLTTIIGELPLDLPSLDAASELAALRLKERLREGAVVVADPLAATDRWSQALLEAHLTLGTVVRVMDGPKGAQPTPLTPSDLEELFAGPEKVHHLRADAADVLYDRTGGHPASVVHRLGAWIRAGIASWRGDRIAIDRAALDRLTAGARIDPGQGGTGAEVPPGPLRDLWLAVDLLEPWATEPRLAALTEAPVWSLAGQLEALVERGVIRWDGRTALTLRPPPRRSWSRERRRQAHLRAAGLVPEDAEARLVHLHGAGRRDAIPAACRRVASHLAESGQAGRAWTVLCEGLAIARRLGDSPEIAPMLRQATCLALSEHDVSILRSTRAEIARSDRADVQRLGALCAEAERYLTGDRTFDSQLEPLQHPSLELWRLTIRASAGNALPVEQHDERIRSLRAQAEALGHLPRWKGWLARVRYRQGRFEESGSLYAEGYDSEPDVVRRNASGLNAAGSWLESGRVQETRRMLDRLWTSVPPTRVAAHEAVLYWTDRSLRYRLGEGMAADPELVEAVAIIGVRSLTGQVAFCEAAHAWRSGDTRLAAELADAAQVAWTGLQPCAAELASALKVSCGLRDESSPLEPPGACDQPLLVAQAIALRPDSSTSARVWARRTLEVVPASKRTLRREILSIQEALERVS